MNEQYNYLNIKMNNSHVPEGYSYNPYNQYDPNAKGASNVMMCPFFEFRPNVPNYMENIYSPIYTFPTQEYPDEMYVPACIYLPANIMKGRYLVSNYGKVWDTYMKQFVPTQISNKVYTMVTISCYTPEGPIFYTKISMHRMVMAAFNYFPGCENFEVNHLDTNLYDGVLHNWLSKLEWCTRKENMEYAVQLGHMDSRPGELSPNAKFTNDQVKNMCELFEQGKSTKEVADIYNVPNSSIQSIKAGKNYSCVSKDYNLPELRKYISEDMVFRICDEINNGKTNVKIAEELGVTVDIVSSIRSGKTWRKLTEGRIEYSDKYLSEQEVHEICRLLSQGYSLMYIANNMGVSKGTVIGIKKSYT